jgi:acetyl esterase
MVFVRDDVQQLLGMLAAVGAPPMNEGTPEEGRAAYRQMGAIAERPAPALARKEDISIPGPAGPIPARLYQPTAKAGDTRVITFFHGGGWVIGDLETHDSLAAEIAAGMGMTVIAIDYRLAPETAFPAAVEDCLAAARWIGGSPAVIGHAVTAQIFCGDSAGGNLSAVCARELRHALPVAAQWLIYPGVDMTATGGSLDAFAEGYLLTRPVMEWFTTQYIRSEADALSPHASPMLSDDWEGLPPALVFTCGLDPLRDQGRAYAGKLIAAGNRVIFREAAGQVHGSAQVRGAIPSAQTDLEAQIADLKALLA